MTNNIQTDEPVTIVQCTNLKYLENCTQNLQVGFFALTAIAGLAEAKRERTIVLAFQFGESVIEGTGVPDISYSNKYDTVCTCSEKRFMTSAATSSHAGDNSLGEYIMILLPQPHLGSIKEKTKDSVQTSYDVSE